MSRVCTFLAIFRKGRYFVFDVMSTAPSVAVCFASIFRPGTGCQRPIRIRIFINIDIKNDTSVPNISK